MSSIEEVFKRNVLSAGCILLCLGKNEKGAFQYSPVAAVVVVLAGLSFLMGLGGL